MKICNDLFTYLPEKYNRKIDYLKHLVFASGKIQANNEAITERILKELALVDKHGYTDFFLVGWDLCNMARERGIFVSPGGIISNTLIAYALGLSTINPIKYGLMHELFFRDSSIKSRDFAIGISVDMIPQVNQYLIERYGQINFDKYILSENNKDNPYRKMEIFGLFEMSLIARASNSIKRTKPHFNIDTVVDMKDRRIFEFARKDQLDFMRPYQYKYFDETRCDNMHDFILLHAPYRTNNEDEVKDYIDIMLGIKKVKNLPPGIKDIVEPTYGLFLFEEQVIEAISRYTSYSYDSAVLCYQIIRSKTPKCIADERNRFLRAAVTTGYYRDDADRLFSLLLNGGDTVAKAIAIANATIDYKIAYIKVKYPLAYEAAKEYHL